jgi:hypothetical protein
VVPFLLGFIAGILAAGLVVAIGILIIDHVWKGWW